MLDRNNYYGGASASLNLADLYQKFKPNTSTIPNELKQYDVNEFQCDLTPKFNIFLLKIRSYKSTKEPIKIVRSKKELKLFQANNTKIAITTNPSLTTLIALNKTPLAYLSAKT